MEAEIAAGGIEFDAEFFHQHFGQDEDGETLIKGYKDLRINLWISAQTYQTWLDIQYSKKKMGADKLEKVCCFVKSILPQQAACRAAPLSKFFCSINQWPCHQTSCSVEHGFQRQASPLSFALYSRSSQIILCVYM